jgi:nucleotide-binding universal stress UspA family protein
MFKKILIAVDGSPVTPRVLETAAEQAKAWKSDLHLIYVIETGWAEGDVARELAIRELEDEARDFVGTIKKEISDMGTTVTTHIQRGHPGDLIVKTAETIGADLVILGSVGRSQIKRMIAGSVSTFVVNHSPVTTMVVKP